MPYQFYILEKLDENRYWKFINRFEYIALDLYDMLLSYSINLFRKLYRDVFSDNLFRKDFDKKSYIFENEASQLLNNILKLTQPLKFVTMCQNIIINNCTYIPQNDDIIKYHKDSIVQFQKYHQFNSCPNQCEDNTTEILQRVFDQIDEDGISDIYLWKGCDYED